MRGCRFPSRAGREGPAADLAPPGLLRPRDAVLAGPRPLHQGRLADSRASAHALRQRHRDGRRPGQRRPGGVPRSRPHVLLALLGGEAAAVCRPCHDVQRRAAVHGAAEERGLRSMLTPGHGLLRHPPLRGAAAAAERRHQGGLPEGAVLPSAVRAVQLLSGLQPADAAVGESAPRGRHALRAADLALRELVPHEAAAEVLRADAAESRGLGEQDARGARQHPHRPRLRAGAAGAAEIRARSRVRGTASRPGELVAGHDAALPPCDQRALFLRWPVLRWRPHLAGSSYARRGGHPCAGHPGLHRGPHGPLRHAARDSKGEQASL
mmetsp:Transcript_125925/g.367927  ORF Transcript_125925/g.367927 Transcript_125925/m.367927 type:complete len:324 (+) Transcript_125925:496-1467(+)